MAGVLLGQTWDAALSPAAAMTKKEAQHLGQPAVYQMVRVCVYLIYG